MAVSNYVTVEEFKANTELTGFNFADNDIPLALTAASRGVDEYTSRFFYSDSSGATVQRYYSPTSRYRIETDDIVSLGTVQADYDRDGVFEQTWTAGVHFNLAPYNAALEAWPYEELELIRFAVPYLPFWPRSIRVTGQFGWPAVPAPVKEATTILAARLMRRAREAPFGVVGVGADMRAIRISKVDTDVAFLLDPYLKHHGVYAA